MRAGGNSAYKQGELCFVAGRITASCQIRAAARMNKGGRPDILGRPPQYVRAVGRIRFSIRRGLYILMACSSACP